MKRYIASELKPPKWEQGSYLQQHGSEGSLRHLEDQGANGVNQSPFDPVNHFTAHLLPQKNSNAMEQTQQW